MRSSAEVDQQLARLPADAAARFAELRVALELNPWAGEPYVRDNPAAPLRSWPFDTPTGDGILIYLVLERERVVDLLQLLWLD